MKNFQTGFLASAVMALCVVVPARAQDGQTLAMSLEVPAISVIDENFVDLTSGALRVPGPRLTVGSGDNVQGYGLDWTGQGWTISGLPTINRNGDRYFVTHKGVTDVFLDRASGFEQEAPRTGASLKCAIWTDANMVSGCLYTSRNGDVVSFEGRYTPQSAFPSNFGMLTLPLGNLGMSAAYDYSGADPWTGRQSYTHGTGVLALDHGYNATNVTLSLGDNQISISTPNHGGSDLEQHYLMPRGVVQSISDNFGSIWQYTIDSNRNITKIQPPGGIVATSYYYASGNRVQTVTNAAGQWSYSYQQPPFGWGSASVTVTSPSGYVKQVVYNNRTKQVEKVIEDLSSSAPSETLYEYNSDRRLIRITYPDKNKLEFDYDVRGNVVARRQIPKPQSSDPILTSTAGYPATCVNRITCNRPIYIIDAMSGRTDYTYSSTDAWNALYRNGSVLQWEPIEIGHGKVSSVLEPALGSGLRRETRFSYDYFGNLTNVISCRLGNSCFGTADQISQSFAYSSKLFHIRRGVRGNGTAISLSFLEMFMPISTSVGDGVERRRTCMEYDDHARLITVTSPLANLNCVEGMQQYSSPSFNASPPEAGQAKSTPTFSQ